MEKSLKKRFQKIMNNPNFSPVTNLFGPVYSGIGSIVMFHRIVRSEKDVVIDDMEISVSQLEKTIQYFLRKGYDIVSIGQAHEIISGSQKSSRKFAVFTFDDGYKDNYTLAYPVFKKYGVPFTIYLTTCFPDKTAVIWWYALEELLEKNVFLDFHFRNCDYNFQLQTKTEKKAAYAVLRELILSLDAEGLKEIFSMLFEEQDIDLRRYTNEMTMDWPEVRELSEDSLVTIGAHTTNHYNLRQLAEEAVREEILESKKAIEKQIGRPVEHFAFPYGSMNEAGLREFAIAEEMGFKTAVTTRCGNIFPAHSRFGHCLPRITPGPDLLASFPQLYASGFVPALRQKFKRVVTQ